MLWKTGCTQYNPQQTNTYHQDTHRRLPYSRPTRDTQLIRVEFDAPRDHSTRHGWTLDLYRLYTFLRLSLQTLRLQEARRNWGRVLTDLANTYKDPRLFWNKVKQLSGRTTGPETYLTNNRGARAHTPQDNETLFRDIWRLVFRDDDDTDDNDDTHQRCVGLPHCQLTQNTPTCFSTQA